MRRGPWVGGRVRVGIRDGDRFRVGITVLKVEADVDIVWRQVQGRHHQNVDQAHKAYFVYFRLSQLVMRPGDGIGADNAVVHLLAEDVEASVGAP